MKKHLFLLSSVLTVGVVLAACGSSDTAEENTGSSPDEATEEVVAEETDDSVPAEETAEETEDSESAEETDEVTDDSEPAGEIEEETDTEDADPAGTLTQSDGQNYELYVLDGYELTAEEPKKDSLFAVDNSAVFMRIETFAPGEIDFTAAEENMIQTLQAVNPEEEPAEVTGFDGEDFDQSTAYEVPSTEGTVTGIVFENEDLLVRLTIFDDSTVNATENFIAMGSTIDSPEE